MKKIIYLILFLPVIGFSQVNPWQIEPDTTHRMIMMTDTSVIDSPAMEFLYFSIDSLVEQIARDTLGLDSTYWSLDDSLSLSPVNQTNNIILGSLSGNTSLTGSYNFIAGGSLGNSLTTGSYNSIFGGSNLSALTTGNYNTFFGFGHSELVTNSSESFISGFDNVSLATSLLRSFVNGRTNAVSTTSLRDAFINGQDNGSGIATSLWYSFFNGLDNLENASNGSYVFANGFGNLKNVTNPNYSFANGLSNLGSGSSVSAQYSFFNGRDNALNSAGSVNYSFLNGHDNLRSGIGIDYGFLSGYRNLYQTTSDIQNTIAIGRENGYNSVDHSNSIYLGYRQGYTTGASNKLLIGMAQDDPLIDGSFSADSLRINGTLSVRDKTGTPGNFAAFDGDKIVDSGVSTLGDPDQTLSFTNPNLTISGSGGNTIDISGVNYWDTNADGIYTLDNVGINTTPHATHPLYVVGTMWLDGPVRDGNGNFSSGTGNIMTANSGGEFLWESPSNIGLSSFNNDAGFLTSEVDGSTTNELQTLSFNSASSQLSISSGNTVTLNSGPWTTAASNEIYFNTAGNDIVGINTISPTRNLQVNGTGYFSQDLEIVQDLKAVSATTSFEDTDGDRGTSGDLLGRDANGLDWVSPSNISENDLDNDMPTGKASKGTNTTISVSGTVLTLTSLDINSPSGWSIGTSTNLEVPENGLYLVVVNFAKENSNCTSMTAVLRSDATTLYTWYPADYSNQIGFSASTIESLTSTSSLNVRVTSSTSGCNVFNYEISATKLSD